ncbi:proteasome regulatory particle base subunit [Vanrija albida]|uniref:26S proteasome regulatory subunit RPN1 n=1 Tax=Vanrija albida TaxID=181172 RepID=A0ABR3PUY2_9TREE
MADKDPREVTLMVPSEDPEKKEDDKPKHEKGKEPGTDKDKDEPEISEEDLQLKSELEMLVERLKEPDTSLYLPALESLRTLIKTSTSSMTSVPKPLKFLRPHYHELGQIRDSWSADLKEQRALLASILSVLAMTYSDTGKRDTLYYRLISGSEEAPGSWGHEYVRHLAAELGEEYVQLVEHSDDAEATEDDAVANGSKTNGDAEDAPKRDYNVEQLRALGLELVDFFLKHNAEADAVDLLLELEYINVIADKVDDKTYNRVCQYMVSCVPLLVPPDDEQFLRTAAAIYAKHDRLPEALALAIRLHDRKLIRKYFEAPTNAVMKKQLAFILARANVPVHWVHTPDTMEPESDEGDEWGTPPDELSEELAQCLGNHNLSTHFRKFGKAVGVEEPRTPEDIYKTQLESRSIGQHLNSARDNLASTFVNAFVNAGFGNEKLVVQAPEGQSFIYLQKERGMLSATASVGMSLLWDHEGGIDHIDKYTYSPEEHIKAGAFLAIGILYSNIRTQPDMAWALLEEHVDNPSSEIKIAAINALGMAYAGSERHYLVERLAPYVADDSSAVDVAANAALAMGFVYVGSGNGDVASTILQTLMEREASQLDSEWSVFFALALGLIFLGRQEAADATLETLKVIEHPIARSAEVLVEVCAYAATGNVLKVQSMLHICAEQPSAAKPKAEEGAAADGEASGEASGEAGAVAGDVDMDAGAGRTVGGDDAADAEPAEPVKADLRHQTMAVIGIALVAMGEDVGAEMALRQFQHLMTYGDPAIRKAVPLALGLISASNPQLTILDTLSKYSHDSDLDVAVNAILAMGLVGGGTNNARLAQMLRGLAVYYAKEPDCLFMVRIAQGLVHMGKGTIGINPFFHDRQILSGNAVAGLLALLVSFTNARQFVLGQHHWQLYWLALAMFPQFLITLDEETEEKAVTVRVGQAVNTIGLAGTRSGISGFQTHQTPVRVGTTERAEMGTNEFFPYTSVLEGFVFIKKNDQYDAEDN